MKGFNNPNPFADMPKSVKKTLRYIIQDVDSLEKLAQIETLMNGFIQDRKIVLEKQQYKDQNS
ncbi:LytR family transcriptional regulator [Metabacillus niabensis]|uniref:LytR family transcriptional regulator n=1 Tax=Metabacillus niabensis TaxID=324854 RepID=UPI001CFBBDB5|nr:LytR family transcriptional regulator [Metabacillus niabensis]